MEINGNKKSYGNSKKVLIISIIFIIVILTVIVVSLLLSKSNTENNSIIVYNTDSATVIRIDSYSVEITEKSASNFTSDKANKRVFYTLESSHTDNLYDLCYVQVKGSEISKPAIIDYAVRDNYSIIDGKAYYLKYNKTHDAFEGYICDLENKTQTCFDLNLDNIYPLKDLNEFYYTKYHADSLSLYKCSDGVTEGPLYSNIKSIYSYNNCDKPHILFETSQNHNDSLTDLFLISAEGEKNICDSTYFVDYDRYKQDGNLYYYSSPDNTVSWSYVISDNYVESDKEIVKPNREDYESEMGVSAGYNEDYLKYQDKLIRDEIRLALNTAVAEKGFNAPVYTAYSFSNDRIYKLAEKLDPSRVYSVSENGTPKIVYDNIVLTTADIDMSTLVTASLRNNLDSVIKYAWSVIDDNVYSNGICLAVSGETESVVHPIDSFEKESTLFSFSQDGERLFAFVKDDNFGSTSTVYCFNFNEKLLPEKEISVSTNVSNYRILNSSVIYMKEDVGKKTGDIFEFDGTESVKLSNAASAFSVYGDSIIAIKNSKTLNNSDVADYYFLNQGTETLIGENVLPTSFVCLKDGRVAFISGENNKLLVYYNYECGTVAENVTSIVLFD